MLIASPALTIFQEDCMAFSLMSEAVAETPQSPCRHGRARPVTRAGTACLITGIVRPLRLVRFVPQADFADFADGGSTAALAICCFGTVSITACRRTWP